MVRRFDGVAGGSPRLPGRDPVPGRTGEEESKRMRALGGALAALAIIAAISFAYGVLYGLLVVAGIAP